MRYSPNPHSLYCIGDGPGPGHAFIGDVEMWNWRWLMIGEGLNEAFDEALAANFNSSQRRLMEKPPAEALETLEEVVPTLINDEIRHRAWDAQRRIDQIGKAHAVKQDGNVYRVNFGWAT